MEIHDAGNYIQLLVNFMRKLGRASVFYADSEINSTECFCSRVCSLMRNCSSAVQLAS